MRLNRYARKRAHKRILKKRHADKFGVFNSNIDRDKQQTDYFETLESNPNSKYIDHRNNGYTYWNQFYLSGRRGFAKRETNRRIRRKYRELIANEHPDNIPTPKGADYEKEFDYPWTVW